MELSLRGGSVFTQASIPNQSFDLCISARTRDCFDIVRREEMPRLRHHLCALDLFAIGFLHQANSRSFFTWRPSFSPIQHRYDDGV